MSLLTTVLPPLGRDVVIDKGADGGHHLAISRNGRVLFLSREPLEDLVGVRTTVRFRAWRDRGPSGERRIRGVVLILRRQRAPEPSDAIPARSWLAESTQTGGLAAVVLSPRRALVFAAPRPS